MDCLSLNPCLKIRDKSSSCFDRNQSESQVVGRWPLVGLFIISIRAPRDPGVPGRATARSILLVRASQTYTRPRPSDQNHCTFGLSVSVASTPNRAI